MGYHYGISVWDIIMGCHSGVLLWDITMGYQYGISLWDVIPGCYYGLSPQFRFSSAALKGPTVGAAAVAAQEAHAQAALMQARVGTP